MNSRRLLIRSPRRHGRAPRRHVKSERLGGLEVDHSFVLGRRLHRQVGRLLAFEDAVNVAGCSLVLIDVVKAKGDQAAAGDEVACVIYGRQSVACCHLDNESR